MKICFVVVLLSTIAQGVKQPVPAQYYNYVQYLPEEQLQSPLEKLENPRTCGPLEQEKVRQCADPLYKIGALTETTTSNLTWHHFMSRTKEYFSEVCDNFFIFDLCIEAYKDTCFGASGSRFRYDAALKILDFLCRDGYGEMIRNFECFTRTLTRAEMMQCQAEMVADTRKIPHGEISDGHQTAVCGAMRNYVGCVKYPIRYECGYRAWQLVREMIVRPAETLLPGCELSHASHIGFFLTIIISVVRLFL